MKLTGNCRGPPAEGLAEITEAIWRYFHPQKKMKSGHRRPHLFDISTGNLQQMLACILTEKRRAQNGFLCFIYNYNEKGRPMYLSQFYTISQIILTQAILSLGSTSRAYIPYTESFSRSFYLFKAHKVSWQNPYQQGS